LLDPRRDLVSQRDHVQSRNVQVFPPNRAIVLHIHGFQGDLQLVACFQVVTGYDLGHAQLAASLLKIQRGTTVFAGGSEGPDRQ
jgi:hypothetical protein